jgi:hypothetical protein
VRERDATAGLRAVGLPVRSPRDILPGMSPVRSISLAVFLAWCSSAHAGDIEGSAKPVDGDSFNIEVRIFGIDAPEPGQTCKDAQGLSYSYGRLASDAMAELLRGKTVRAKNGTKTPSTGGPSGSRRSNVTRVRGLKLQSALNLHWAPRGWGADRRCGHVRAEVAGRQVFPTP